MGSFPTAVQQEFLYQDEPLVGASVCSKAGLGFRATLLGGSEDLVSGKK